MEQQFCSQAKDPAKCQERIEKRAQRRQGEKKQ
jgi:hypothetical protein